jgi:hypothetical protein
LTSDFDYVAAPHTPVKQASPVGQAWKHWPQLTGLLDRLTQLEPQSVNPAGQAAHTPPAQLAEQHWLPLPHD